MLETLVESFWGTRLERWREGSPYDRPYIGLIGNRKIVISHGKLFECQNTEKIEKPC